MFVETLRDVENLLFSVGCGAQQAANLVDDRLISLSRFRLKAEILDPILRQPFADFSRLTLEFLDHPEKERKRKCIEEKTEKDIIQKKKIANNILMK